MNNEVPILINGVEIKIFLQNGFYDNDVITSHVHKHNYPEIHLIRGGEAAFRIADKEYTFCDGTAFIIPERTIHYCMRKDEGIKHTAFQLSYNFEYAEVKSIRYSGADDLFELIEGIGENHDYSRICALISFLIAELSDSPAILAKPIVDYGFLISDFFSHEYNRDITLSDLAGRLHTSERHAERLVMEHTGNTFIEELTLTRLDMADYLFKTTDMARAEIAEYVGYKSYGGFYKALKRHQAKMQT